MILFRITFTLCIALCSAYLQAAPTTYTAAPVILQTSVLKLDARVTSKSSGGYCANVAVRNAGDERHDGWQVVFDIGNNSLKHLNGAKYSVSGSIVTVTPISHEVSIEPKHQHQFEFCAKGKSGPSVFQQSVKVSNHAPIIALTTSHKLQVKDHGHVKDKYCVVVTTHNHGPDKAYDWRLKLDLGSDKLTSMEHGRPDKTTGFIAVTPLGGHRHIKNGHDRTIKFCAKRSDNACNFVSESPPSVTILSPNRNSTHSMRSVFVSGVYSGPVNTGITVNGVVAHTDEGRFYANNVPLQAESNIVKAVATTSLGQTSEDRVDVRLAESVVEMDLWVSPNAGGSAPLKASFKTIGTDGVRRIAVDFDGNGSVDYSSDDPRVPIEHIYTNLGLHVAKLAVTDEHGRLHHVSYAVPVIDANKLDDKLRLTFENLNDALTCGQVDRAIKYISINSRDRYKPVFQSLRHHFKEILASFSPLQQSLIAPSVAEYLVNRTVDGVDNVFFIYFVQGDDGVWRIESM